MDIVSVGTVPGSDSRSCAVGDWRNMISSLVMWVAVTCGFSKPIPAACMYNMDDTTIFLEQKFGQAGKRTFVSRVVKDVLRVKNLSFSFGISKSKKDKQRKKSKNTQARTVKILLCTCADGTTVCTVIKIKDTAITRFRMQPINLNLWIVWDPKIPKTANRQAAEPKTVRRQRTSCILKNAILPAIKDDMKQKRERQSSTMQSFYEDGSVHSSQDSHAADECYDRGILSMDGDFSQVDAILEDERLTSAFRDANVELFKFAAGASMTQQPNDRSRCFYCLKKALREHKVHLHFNVDTASAFQGLKHKKVIRALQQEIPDKGQSKTSFATFNFFLNSCDVVFSQAFTVGNVRGGWMKCGLAPFNPQVMMESYAFFKDLEKIDPTAHQQVLDAIPKLATLARESGMITDEQMEAELGELFAKSPTFAAMYNRPVVAHAPVNHRRCIWLSNPGFLDTERAHRLQRVQAAAAVVEAAALRRAAAPRSRSTNPANSAPASANSINPVNSAPSSVSDLIDLPWSGVPCKWTSCSGVEILCGSYDKQKGQHQKSDKHKAFLAKVTAELARAPPFQDAGGAAEIRDEDDPLAAENLGLVALSRSNPQSEEESSDSESDSVCDDSMPDAGGGAVAGLRSRSPSTTPLPRPRAGGAPSSSSSPPTASRQNRRFEEMLSPTRYVRFV
jgi:hypothetical protein